MSVVKNVVGIEVNLEPFSSKGYKVVNLHMIESLGGSLAGGEIELWHDYSDDALELVTEQQTGTLTLRDTKEGGIEYEIPIFIKSRKFLKLTLSIEFVCISDIKFLEKPLSTEYDNIDDAIKTLYPGKRDIRTSTDIANDLKIYQCCETSYELCTKLAYSFRHEIVFSYSWEGLVLKELCGENNSAGEKEIFNNIKLKLNSEALMQFKTKYNLNYSKKLNFNPINPWEDTDDSSTGTDYTDYEFLNNRSLVDYDSYALMGTDYYQLQQNYYYNRNLMDAGMYSSLIISGRDFPGYKIGDVIEFRSPEQNTKYPFTKFLVASNEVFFGSDSTTVASPNGNLFEWTSVLYGLDPGKWGEKES